MLHAVPQMDYCNLVTLHQTARVWMKKQKYILAPWALPPLVSYQTR